ncbi:TetR/AcrR family transcriptional regulator [Kineosporia babensis]|uniref:TetR/AcrR family transcriptional regulator n=1 Tax=Kineosporia babensis TaxID=499548 RepID=A0A9X1NC32_9ACTN|nr:TetR/AcrR family transcriptional regulator [Kineosporia babensis]MCD5311099.1 TetR/AcrR family transcriptional regulator [Kineosporia babensis]
MESTENEPAPAARRHHGNRHRRSEEARISVLQAVDGLLVEIGYARLTIEGIAQRAGVSKQTIYRWWSSKDELLMDAFSKDASDWMIPSDTGRLRDDLRAHAQRVAEFMANSDAGAVFRALLAQAQHDGDLAERLRSEFLVEQKTYERLPLEAALQRGELPQNADPDLLAAQVFGPIYYRVLVSGETVTPAFIDALVDLTLANTVASGSRPGS